MATESPRQPLADEPANRHGADDATLSSQCLTEALPKPLEANAAASQLIAELCERLQHCWAIGQPSPLDDFFQQHAALLANEPHAVDLIYADFTAAEERGLAPSAEEYVRRFPRVAEALRRQFELHAAFSAQDADILVKLLRAPQSRARAKTPPLWIACPGMLDRYHLVAPLDSGGQAQVFRAVHPDIEQEVVIKIGHRPLREELPGAHVLAEGKLLAGLSHPQIARVFDVGVFQERPYLVMEYVRGRNLAQAARWQAYSPQQAAALVAKLARALGAAHALGIVHLDIKPKNIVIDPAGEPKLIDFGLARTQSCWDEPAAEPGSLTGTLQFMSPEQANCQTDRIGPQSDIFALGGVLYFLLTGQPPIAGETFAEALANARQGQWDTARLTAGSLPPRLVEIVVAALASSPAERISSTGELAERLETFLQTEAAPRRKSRAFVAPAAGVGLLLLAGVVGICGFVGSRFWPAEAPIEPLVRQTVQKPLLPAVVQQAPAQTAPAQTAPALHVNYWDDALGRFLPLHAAAPLQSGDRIQLVATIPPGVFSTVFLVSSTGQVRELASAEAAATEQTIRFPTGENQVVPLTGAPGTEVLLVCGRRGSRVQAAELEALLRELPWPRLPEYSILRMTKDRVEVEQAGRDLGSPQTLPSPESVVRSHLDHLRQSLAADCPLLEAIAFCHQ